MKTTQETTQAAAGTLCAVILLTAIVPAAWGGPFTNGGFELPTLPANTWLWLSPGVTNPPGVTNLVGWTVGGSSTGTILVNGVPSPGIGLNPLVGAQHVIFDVDNLPTGGTIAQTFDTEVGRTYTVSFNVGKEEAAPGTMELTATVTASDGYVLGSLAAPQESFGWGPTNTLTFTATTLSSTLTFEDTSTTTLNTDVGLDNVSVQALGLFTNGLIAYYPFNGNANDASGNGNNGVVSGATLTQDQFGRSGMAYAFNGSNSLITFSIPNIPTGASPRSISLWAAANPIPSTPECLAVWGAAQYGLAFGIEDNSTPPLTWWGALFGPPPTDDLNSGVIVDTNWHQLVFVYDGTNASIAINGVQKATGSRSPNTAFSAFIVGVGIGPGGLSGFFSGTIDDVRIYNRALSTNEVAQLYAIESTPPSVSLTNGLLAYYPLTTDGTDQSGHGLDLTLSNVVFSTVGSAGDMRPAASFDGQSSYGIVNQALITGQTNWTWAAWLYSPPGATQSLNEQWIYMEGLQSGPCFGIIINDINEPGTLGIAAWNVGLSGNWMHHYVPNVLTNGWNHLAFTLANGGVGTGTLSIFFNGVLTNSSVFQSAVPQDTSPPIGVIGHGWLQSWLTAPWKGSMSDLRFYDRALSSNEVAQLYAIESVPPCTPYAATASAIVTNGFVINATITDSGCGYTNTPGVRIIGGGGSGAEAVAVVSSGVVVAVNILDAGSGYTNANTLTMVIAPPFIPQPTMGIAALSLLSFTNLALGTNYQLQFFSANSWSDVGPAFTAASSASTQLVSGTAGPNAYRLAVTPVPQQAYATAQMVDGFVVAATVTSGGSGYTTNPVVTILNDAGGSNATAIATVSGGVVTGVTMTDAGIGYTNAPTIVIAPPPANALSPVVTQVMELGLGSLSPYDNYQLEFTPIVGGAWNSLGLPFTPTSATSTQRVNVSGNAGFFRVRYVP